MQPHRRQPTRLPHPWDSPGKNTGVGCHFLLQGTHYQILELVSKLRQFESTLFAHFMCVHVYKEISQTYRNVQRLIKRIHCAYIPGLSSPQPFNYKAFHSQSCLFVLVFFPALVCVTEGFFIFCFLIYWIFSIGSLFSILLIQSLTFPFLFLWVCSSVLSLTFGLGFFFSNINNDSSTFSSQNCFSHFPLTFETQHFHSHSV